jgi:hypothetical protein
VLIVRPICSERKVLKKVERRETRWNLNQRRDQTKNFFLQQTYILKLKQPFYKKVLEEDRNYIKVHISDKNKYIDAFDDGKLAGGPTEASKALAPGWRTA